MGGWGAEKGPALEQRAADDLAESVRRWIATPSTGNCFKVEHALERYDHAKAAMLDARRREVNSHAGVTHGVARNP